MKTNFNPYIISKIIAGLCLLFAASCSNAKPDGGENPQKDSIVMEKRSIDTVKFVSSLEELYSYCPKYTFIETCDLSNLGLKEIPVLKLYNIKRLNLSHNEFRLVKNIDFLPTSLEELDLSCCNFGLDRSQDYEGIERFTHSLLRGLDVDLNFSVNEFPNLKKLNLSYNKLHSFRVPNYTEVTDEHFNDSKGVKNEVRKIEKRTTAVKQDTVKTVKSLEELYELVPATVIEFCDLSKQDLKDLPVLRPYNIKRLDISENNFSHFVPNYYLQKKFTAMLPESLVELDMNNCRWGEIETTLKNSQGKRMSSIDLILSKRLLPNLKTVDLSNNCFGRIIITSPVVNLNVSRNRLIGLSIRTKTLKHLDVSYNWDMNDVLGIPPESLKTLKADSCAHGRKKFRENAWYLCSDGDGKSIVMK